jgi:radical SAM-linked protein
MLFRSGFKLYFSQGFNPTPRFSLGIALPIFVESEGELIDIELSEHIEPEKMVKRFNEVLPSNIKVLKAEKITRQTTAIDILAQWSEFLFTPIKEGILKNEDLVYIKDTISSSNEIFIEKISKKGIKKLVNIKQSIKSVEVSEDKLYMILKVGQAEDIPSVKPEDVVKLFVSDIDFKIRRMEFYDKDMNKL